MKKGLIIEVSSKMKDRIEMSIYPDDNSPAAHVELGFEVDSEDFHIATLHRYCRYFALCLGFAPESVDKYFGEETDDDFWRDI